MAAPVVVAGGAAAGGSGGTGAAGAAGGAGKAGAAGGGARAGSGSWAQQAPRLSRVVQPSGRDEDDDSTVELGVAGGVVGGVLLLILLVITPVAIVQGAWQNVWDRTLEAARETWDGFVDVVTGRTHATGRLMQYCPPAGAQIPCIIKAYVPADSHPFLAMYVDAAHVYGVSPFVLMAVHEDESHFGTSRLPGVRTGVNTYGCCAGPMQFLITGGAEPAVGGSGGTWAGYRDAYRAATLERPDDYPNRFEPHPNVYDSFDAIYAAAKYLHVLGAGPRLDDRTLQALARYKGTPPGSMPYARHDFERAQELERVAAGTRSQLPKPEFAWPLPDTLREITSEFGPRTEPAGFHQGIDIKAGTGTPIFAAASGSVRHTGWMGDYGNTVILDHGDGRETLYAHQHELAALRRGDHVEGGETIIGYVGSTGDSTGPHLHFEVRIGGRPVDPIRYLGGARR